MYEFWNLVKYNIMCYFRDIKSVIVRLLEVVIITLVMGFALKDNYVSGSVELNKFNVGLCIEDKGIFSNLFREYIGNSEFKEVVEIISFNNIYDAKQQLALGKIKNIIYIQNNYSDKLSQGEKGEIRIITERERNYFDNTVKGLVQSFNRREEMKLTQNKLKETSSNAIKIVDIKYITAKDKRPKLIDYYGVTMLVMFILSSSRQGCRAYWRVKKTSLGERKKIAPISKGVDISSNIIAQFILGTFEWFLYVTLCKWGLGVNYGSNIFIFIALCSVFSIFSIFFGMVVTEIVGNYGKTQIILRIFVYLSTFLTGGFSGSSITASSNGLLNKIFNLLPNNFAHTVLFSYIYSENKGGIISSLFSMFMEITVLILIAFIVGRKRKA